MCNVLIFPTSYIPRQRRGGEYAPSQDEIDQVDGGVNEALADVASEARDADPFVASFQDARDRAAALGDFSSATQAHQHYRELLALRAGAASRPSHLGYEVPAPTCAGHGAPPVIGRDPDPSMREMDDLAQAHQDQQAYRGPEPEADDVETSCERGYQPGIGSNRVSQAGPQ